MQYEQVQAVYAHYLITYVNIVERYLLNAPDILVFYLINSLLIFLWIKQRLSGIKKNVLEERTLLQVPTLNKCLFRVYCSFFLACVQRTCDAL